MSLKEHIQRNIDRFDTEELSASAESFFEQKLKQELHKPKKGKLIYLRYAAVAACLAILYTIAMTYMSEEAAEESKQLLVANLNDTSAGTRLEAVYEFDDSYAKEDDQIIELLLDILYDDSNANVRIATIDALLKFPHNEKIRTNLIQALDQEKTPLVQIKLIKSLSILRENRAQNSLQKLIDDEETLPIVTNNASLAMAEIEGYN